MAKHNSKWLDNATAEAFECGTHVLVKTNLRPPGTSVLPAPGRTMEKWDPRGQLARVTWNRIIQDALSKIEYQCLENAVVLAIVRAPFPRFDPINMNPQFALEAMAHCSLIEGTSPGQTLYAAIGHRDTQGGTDFYVGPPEFVPEMMQIISKVLGDSWSAEAMGNDYFLTAQLRDIIPPQRIPPKEWPISQAIAQTTGEPPKATLFIEKTHIVFKTNIYPPQVGIPVPQGFLPFSLFVSWVKDARGAWVNLLENHRNAVELQTIKKSVVLIVFRTQNPHFDPINFDIKTIINILVALRIIKDDSFDTLAYFAVAQQCYTGGGLDIYIGTPDFFQKSIDFIMPIIS